MHTHDISAYTHEHVFDLGNPAAERGTRIVMWVTSVMMVIEIAGGWWLNSMAFLADGWHMSSHAIAIGLSAFAYAAARRYQNNYNDDELAELGREIEAITAVSVHVVLNNNYEDQGQRNARTLMSFVARPLATKAP